MPAINFNIKRKAKYNIVNVSKEVITDCVPVKGYEHNYVIDEFGNIYSIKDKYGNDRIRKMSIVIHNGYKTIMMTKDGKHNREFVHRLVAATFIPNPNNYRCVNHKDENKLNNCYNNLEWCTHQYNTNYSRNISEWNKDRGFDIIVNDIKINIKYTFRSVREAAKFLHVDRFKFTKTINTDILYNNRYKSYYVQ
jgi:hypothetical protein